jgi:hypothetical protein
MTMNCIVGSIEALRKQSPSEADLVNLRMTGATYCGAPLCVLYAVATVVQDSSEYLQLLSRLPRRGKLDRLMPETVCVCCTKIMWDD